MPDMFIYDVVCRSAARWPEAVAVSDARGSLTFEALRSNVASLARGLQALGLTSGQRVIDLQTNSVSYLLTDLAIPAAGLVRVAVNYRLTAKELEYIVNDSGATAIIYGARFRDVVADLMRNCENLVTAVGVDDSSLGHSLEDVLSLSGDGMLRTSGQPSDLVSLNYSSGTTGKPKGCMRTARNRYASTVDILLSMFDSALGPEDTMLHAGPITHASGLFVLPFIAAGGRQHLLEAFDATEVARRLSTGDATVTVLVPTMLERVMTHANGATFDRVRAMIYAGAPMPVERIKAAREIFSCKLVQFYGMVEAIPPVTVLDSEAHADDDLLSSAGRPPLGVHIEIVDNDGRRCTTDELGEVLVGGDHVMSGYWGKSHADGKAFKNGLLRTGDIGRLDDRGYLHLVDRQGDMIITGGYNVYPREVEGAVRGFPGVTDVAVVGIPDAEWGQSVTAFVVQESPSCVEVKALSQWCGQRLAAFKKPKTIVFVDELPRTTIGKIDRKALARSYAEAVDNAVGASQR
jgi:acyl-CoA synthetase (AMP-forming)/AMP-acid ligase II